MDYATHVTEQVTESDWQKLQELDVNLDTTYLANIWTDFVNRETREVTEQPFLQSHLELYEKPLVFDVGMGSGASSIGLKKHGVEVISNEIDQDLINVAKEEAAKEDIDLTLTSYDWRNLNNRYGEVFDAVILLGNSLTYLFHEDDQRAALDNFYDILRPQGKLIIDERNYADHFLDGEYTYTGDHVYCGTDEVEAHPIYTSETMVVMEYSHVNDEKKAHLVLYPFKRNELSTLLEETGFNDVTQYYPYEQDRRRSEADFITYVGRK